MLFKISCLHSEFNWKDMMVMLWWMWKHGCYMLTTFSIVSKEEYKQTRHSCQRSNSNWGFNSYNFAFWYRFEWSFVSPLSLLSFLSWSIGSVAFSDLQLLPVFHRCHFRPWDLAVWFENQFHHSMQYIQCGIASLVPSSLNTPLSTIRSYADKQMIPNGQDHKWI